MLLRQRNNSFPVYDGLNLAVNLGVPIHSSLYHKGGLLERSALSGRSSPLRGSGGACLSTALHSAVC